MASQMFRVVYWVGVSLRRSAGRNDFKKRGMRMALSGLIQLGSDSTRSDEWRGFPIYPSVSLGQEYQPSCWYRPDRQSRWQIGERKSSRSNVVIGDKKSRGNIRKDGAGEHWLQKAGGLQVKGVAKNPFFKFCFCNINAQTGSKLPNSCPYQYNTPQIMWGTENNY